MAKGRLVVTTGMDKGDTGAVEKRPADEALTNGPPAKAAATAEVDLHSSLVEVLTLEPKYQPALALPHTTKVSHRCQLQQAAADSNFPFEFKGLASATWLSAAWWRLAADWLASSWRYPGWLNLLFEAILCNFFYLLWKINSLRSFFYSLVYLERIVLLVPSRGLTVYYQINVECTKENYDWQLYNKQYLNSCIDFEVQIAKLNRKNPPLSLMFF